MGKGNRITTSIGGDLSGQLAVGHHITQEHRSTSVDVEITAEDRAQVLGLMAELRAKVLTEAPESDQPAALERVAELEKAVLGEQVKVSTIEYVKDWFLEHVPRLGGMVTSVIVGPIVGKVVEAGGELVSAEFKRRFGRPPL